MNILIVCTANICRSPVAKIFLEEELSQYDVRITTAGTDALPDNRVDFNIERIMRGMRYDSISKHLSTPLRLLDILDYQLILCMEKAQISTIIRRSPVSAGKVFLLGHWSDRSDVVDPVNGTVQQYTDAIQVMNLYCYQWANKIVELNSLKLRQFET